MAVKVIECDERLDPTLRRLVLKAEQTVLQVLGRAADRVEVAWEAGPENAEGEPTARIVLTDEGIRRTGEFTAWDLEDGLQLRRGLRGVWDQVQEERLRIHLQRLRELAESEVE